MKRPAVEDREFKEMGVASLGDSYQADEPRIVTAHQLLAHSNLYGLTVVAAPSPSSAPVLYIVQPNVLLQPMEEKRLNRDLEPEQKMIPLADHGKAVKLPAAKGSRGVWHLALHPDELVLACCIGDSEVLLLDLAATAQSGTAAVIASRVWPEELVDFAWARHPNTLGQFSVLLASGAVETCGLSKDGSIATLATWKGQPVTASTLAAGVMARLYRHSVSMQSPTLRSPSRCLWATRTAARAP